MKEESKRKISKRKSAEQKQTFFRQEGRDARSSPSPEVCWYSGGETCYRLPLLPLQAGHWWVVVWWRGGEVGSAGCVAAGGYMFRSSSISPTGPTSRSSISSSSYSSFSSLSCGSGVNPRPICPNRATRYGVLVVSKQVSQLKAGGRGLVVLS